MKTMAETHEFIHWYRKLGWIDYNLSRYYLATKWGLQFGWTRPFWALVLFVHRLGVLPLMRRMVK